MQFLRNPLSHSCHYREIVKFNPPIHKLTDDCQVKTPINIVGHNFGSSKFEFKCFEYYLTAVRSSTVSIAPSSTEYPL